MNGSEDKRHSFRIETKIPVRFRRVKPEEATWLAANIVTQEQSRKAGAQQVGGEVTDFQTRLLRRLESIDEKLELLLNLIATGRERARNEFEDAYADNISGGGARLTLHRRPELRTGDQLELHLFLAGYPGRPVRILARVVRVEEAGAEPESVWLLGLAFEVIGETDRETVVSYTFQCQRRALQKRAEEAGS